MMTDLKDRVLFTIKEKGWFRAGDKVLAGFSGGADSLFLLLFLHEFKEKLAISVEAVHVHHGIRKDTADRDEAFCRAFCEERGIKLYVCHRNAKDYAEERGLSLEEGAREVRYQAFYEICEKTGTHKIALAHHKNDAAETFLFQLIRGSGLRGLSGIPESRTMTETSGGEKIMILRPLLSLTKEEIKDYLASHGLTWCEDETNEELSASRNRIRHQVIPELEMIRPDAVDKIWDTAEYLAKVDGYLTGQADDWLEKHTLSEEEKSILIDRALFQKEDPVLQPYIVMQMLRRKGLSVKDVTREHLMDIRRLSEKDTGKKLDLPGRITVKNTYEGLWAGKEDPAAGSASIPSFIMILTEKEGVNGEKPPNSPYTKWFDYDKILERPELRYRREGDVLAVFPESRKKLNRFFIDEKIPKEEREKIPVVASGHDILWVVGYRMSEAYKITDSTRRILEIRIKQVGEENNEG